MNSHMDEQQPVAWMDDFGNAFPLAANKGAGSWRDSDNRNWTPLYALPVANKDTDRLLGLCKWAAGRLTDAGDDEGSAKVLESLAAMAKGK